MLFRSNLFNSKGVSFPFGSIEFVDYENEGSIVEIFSYAAPKPSVCKMLTDDTWRDEAVQILKKENKLIIAGESGSGKTTMVYGIAGVQSGKKVYKFTIGEITNADAATQIFLFLVSVKNVVLIIDDANTKLQGEFIEKILAASDSSCQVIIVNTRNDFKSEHNVEQHFLNSVKYIGWNEIKHTVKSSLLLYEGEIVDFLKDKLVSQNGLPLGMGQLNTSLNYFINNFINSSTTVWQFIFLLGGGLEKVGDIQRELNHHCRFDIVLLYISIKQISEFEKGCTVDEILELYKTNSILKPTSQPLRDSLQRELDLLCDRRYLKNEFGKYKTIHRQFAKKFIENFYKTSSTECSELLNTVFKNYSNVKEIVILWSWLQNSPVKPYISKWCNAEETKWVAFVETACYESVPVFGLLAHLMDSASNGKSNGIVKSAFINRTSDIAELINSEESIQFYHVSEILKLLDNHAPEVIAPMCKLLDKEKIINSIKTANAEEFKYISSVFNYIWKHSQDWIFEVVKKIDTADFEAALKRVQKGDVETIDLIMLFFARFVFDVYRSHIETLTSSVYTTLKDCSLKEMSFPVYLSGLAPVTIFEQDVEKILSALDSDKLAAEFVTVTPRFWKQLLQISVFSMRKHMFKLEEIIEKIDLAVLIKNVQKYYLDSSYEFRILIYLFCNGSEKKKADFAAQIFPFVTDICSKYGESTYYDKDVIEAFFILSPNLAPDIISKYGIDLKIAKKKERHQSYSFEKKIKEAVDSGLDFVIFERGIDQKAT